MTTNTKFTDNELASFYNTRSITFNNGVISNGADPATIRHKDYEYSIQLAKNNPNAPQDQIKTILDGQCAGSFYIKPATPRLIDEPIDFSSEIDRFLGKPWPLILQGELSSTNVTAFNIQRTKYEDAKFELKTSKPFEDIRIMIQLSKDPDDFVLLSLFDIMFLQLFISAKELTYDDNGTPIIKATFSKVEHPDIPQRALKIKVGLTDSLRVTIFADKLSSVGDLSLLPDDSNKVKFHYENKKGLTQPQPFELNTNLPPLQMPDSYSTDERYTSTTDWQTNKKSREKREKYNFQYFKEKLPEILEMNQKTQDDFINWWVGQSIESNDTTEKLIRSYIYKHAMIIQGIINNKHSYKDIKPKCNNKELCDFDFIRYKVTKIEHNFKIQIKNIIIPTTGGNIADFALSFEDLGVGFFKDNEGDGWNINKPHIDPGSQKTKNATTYWDNNKPVSMPGGDHMKWSDNAKNDGTVGGWIEIDNNGDYIDSNTDNIYFKPNPNGIGGFWVYSDGVSTQGQVSVTVDFPKLKPDKTDNKWYLDFE